MLRNLTVTLLLMLSLPAGAQDRSTPEATVRSFLAAFESADMKAACACVKGAQPDNPILQGLSQQIKKDTAKFTLSDVKSTVTGTSAVVTGQVTMKMGKSADAQTMATSVNLISSGGTWQIVPDPDKVKEERKPDMVNALAYVLTDTKVFTKARDAARAVSCLSNVKQIGLAAMMFLQDYDEVFKLKAESYKKSLMPYIKNETIFKCPSDTSGGPSYSFNANLAGINIAKVKAPAETVLIYEGKGGQLNFRHDGKAAVGFADGHAKLMNAEGAKKMRWKP